MSCIDNFVPSGSCFDRAGPAELAVLREFENQRKHSRDSPREIDETGGLLEKEGHILSRNCWCDPEVIRALRGIRFIHNFDRVSLNAS